MTRVRLSLLALLAAAVLPAAPAMAQLSINTSNASDWKISNGSISLDWNSSAGNIWGIYLTGHTDDLVDTTQLNGNGQPKGLYMDNVGSFGGGTTTAGYHLNSGHYLDWWITTTSSSSGAMTISQHFVVFPNDPGVHVYIVFTHSSTDIAGSLGQVQYVFRISQSLFNNTYSYNSGLNNLGATQIPIPVITAQESSDPGRNVQNACLDLHGISLPTGFDREFDTKYDYSSFEYLHELHGVYGSTYGCWAIFPRTDSLVGGPGKQDLIFTGNICMGELLSDHLAYNVGYTPPQGVSSTRIFGPVYYRFNTGSASTRFNDALNAMATALSNEDSDTILNNSGHVPASGRGSVQANVAGGGSGSSHTAWVVLADNKTDFQFTNQGGEYWESPGSSGSVLIPGVVPGTYRLSAYVLGQWGEARTDNIAVSSSTTTTVNLGFTPENFSSASPVWTIGTPTRSADKFLHGTATFANQGNGTVQDDREYPGNWNFWQDFQSTSGAVVYYATAVGSHGATNNLLAWNYTQWNKFDPGLYAGIYNSSDDTTDGYKYICPSYVGDPSTALCPPWQVYFTTTSSQLSQGQYVILSVGFASTNGNVTVSLNGNSLTWNGSSTKKTSDAATRSGLQGTYQWVVFQWPTSALAAAGASNEITLSTSGSVEYDALRMEIANTSAAPSVRGWNDYEYVTSGTYVPANDSVANP